jgi:hypothetical protein
MIGESGHLRQMRDAQHLVRTGKPSSDFRPTASATPPPMPLSISSNTSVRCTPLAPPACRLSEPFSERQRDARKLAARRHFIERTRLFARIGRDQKLHAIRAFSDQLASRTSIRKTAFSSASE